MNFYGLASLVREAFRDIARHRGERRGRRTKIDGARALREYVELEAHARAFSNGNLSAFLRDHRLRIPRDGESSNPAWERLNKADRERLRKRYQMGKVELDFWRDMRCRYGPPLQTMLGQQIGEEHPIYAETMKSLYDRIAELNMSQKGLFFLKIFRDEDTALADNHDHGPTPLRS